MTITDITFADWMLFACLSAVLAALQPSFMKCGGKRSASAPTAAVFATIVFLFAIGQSVIAGTLPAVEELTNDTLVKLVITGALKSVSWLCLFTALSTGAVIRVMPILYLTEVCTIGIDVLTGGPVPGLWKLCCIVLILLGVLLCESRTKKEKSSRWLLFSVVTLCADVAYRVLSPKMLALPDTLMTLGSSFTAAVLLWILSLAGKSLKSLGRHKAEDWIFLLLAGISVGLAGLCDTAAAGAGDTSWLLPISLCSFPLTFLFARIFHKEKMPATAVFGMILALAGTFTMHLYL